MEHGMQRVKEISDMVENRLLQFGDFLRVKDQRSMTSYLEEFPGLVHFLHIDRSTGRIIAPYITNESSLIPKDKVCAIYRCQLLTFNAYYTRRRNIFAKVLIKRLQICVLKHLQYFNINYWRTYS